MSKLEAVLFVVWLVLILLLGKVAFALYVVDLVCGGKKKGKSNG